MCVTCGCHSNAVKIGGIDFAFPAVAEMPLAAHAPGTDPRRMVQIERDILSKNDAEAESNRAFFRAQGITAVNMLSSPGSGKTTLLVRTITDLGPTRPIAVIEGDQQTSNDAERIRATGAPALQINTGRGCHLDSHMVAMALPQLSPQRDSFLFIENVGNLVCPSAFDLGEGARAVVISVTEGEDKPVKYPDMFASADVVLVNKIDLLPYISFNLAALEDAVRKVNRHADILKLSATTGEGLANWYGWLAARRATLMT